MRSIGTRRRAATMLTLLAATTTGIAVPAPAAAAASVFKVNVVSDGSDVNVGDGICDAAAGSKVKCSLRAAIQEANADPDDTEIRFAITAGTGATKTIVPNSALPTITQPLTIDGYSQAGSAPNSAANGTNAVLTVELDGRYITAAGITAIAPVTLKGLAIFWFGRGVQLSAGSDGSKVLGCFLGTSGSGTEDRGNDSTGILVNSEDVRIGSPAKADRNLISGNSSSGINLGILARRAVVQNNLIGTGKNGRKDMGNDGDGIFITGSRGHLIGGELATQGNTIAFNGGDGVTLISVTVSGKTYTPNAVRILSDSLFQNGDLAIDIDDDGITPNDRVPDPDAGPNGRMNYPKITAATVSGSDTKVDGTIATRRDIDVLIQLFGSPAGDPQAKTLLDAFTVHTDANGRASFSRTVGTLAVGSLVTATATDVTRSTTSEVSRSRAVAG